MAKRFLKIARKFSKFGPNVLQIWAKSSPKFGHKFSKNSPNITLKMPKTSSKTAQKFPYNWPKVAQKFLKNAEKFSLKYHVPRNLKLASKFTKNISIFRRPSSLTFTGRVNFRRRNKIWKRQAQKNRSVTLMCKLAAFLISLTYNGQ